MLDDLSKGNTYKKQQLANSLMSPFTGGSFPQSKVEDCFQAGLDSTPITGLLSATLLSTN